jgi:multicomponent Na+:H+ antiporter subunit A
MMIHLAVLSGFVAAVLAAFFRGRLREYAGWLLALLPAGLTVYFLNLLVNPGTNPWGSYKIPWAPNLGIDFSLRVDGLGLLFALLISGIGTL